MASFTWPAQGGNGGVTIYSTFASFPSASSVPAGTLGVAADAGILYESNGVAWQVIAGPGVALSIGTIDSEGAPSANAATISSNQLILQSASATAPGVVNATTQTFAGAKTLTGLLNANGGIDRSSAGTLTIGATNSTTINIGNAGATVNIQGTTIYENTPLLQVADPLITVNHGGGAGSGQNAGIEVEENSIITGYNETSSDRNSWILKAPNTAGIVTITPGSSGFTIDQASHNPVTLGTFGSSPNSSGASLSTQILTLQPADATNPGGVSTTTQTFAGVKTFSSAPNLSSLTASLPLQLDSSKNITSTAIDLSGSQATGTLAAGRFPALTGDVTTSAGSLETTIGSNKVANSQLAQMAANTIKGNNTAGTANAVDLTVSQTQTLLSVPTSSSPLALNAGGTGTSAASANASFNALSPMTTGGDIIYGGASGVGTRLANGSSGQVLQSAGGTSAPTWTSLQGNSTALKAPTTQVFTSGSGTYTKPTSPSPLYLKVKMIGGGGGGAGSGTTPGAAGDGGVSTFGSAFLTANGGAKGTTASGGSGGTATGGFMNITGGTGGNASGATNFQGGAGGIGVLGGGGPAGGPNNTGQAGIANTGGGGSGAGDGATMNTGGGGGAGGYLEAIVGTPSSTYAYAVGGAGTAGTAGTAGQAGSAGGSGIVIVEEYYQ